MKKELKRLGTLMLAAAMSVSGLTACGGKGNETGAATEVTATGGAATQSTAAEAASYPLDTDVTVTYWSELNVTWQQTSIIWEILNLVRNYKKKVV